MASGSWQPRKGAPNVSVGKREWRTPSPQFASVWPQGRAGAFCFPGRSLWLRKIGEAIEQLKREFRFTDSAIAIYKFSMTN
jgi:hypothetical protein